MHKLSNRFACCVCLSCTLWLAQAAGPNAPSRPLPQASSAPQFAAPPKTAVPLVFEENAGQTDASVQFLSRASGYTLFLTAESAVYRVRGAGDTDAAVRMVWAGKSAAPACFQAEDLLPSVSHYFTGNDPQHWRTGVRHYARLRTRSVYKDVDLVFYSSAGNRHEFDFVVHPGADPSVIALRWEGVDSIRRHPDGSLALQTPAGELVQKAPRVYQEIGGRQVPVEASYRIEHSSGEIRFAIAAYDRSRPLVIDPIVQRASYLGGAGAESIRAIATGPNNTFLYAGTTGSANFPSTNAIDNTLGGDTDAFLCRSNADLSVLSFCTYLGGSVADRGKDIAVGSDGTVYVAAYTESNNFPVLNAADGTLGGGADYTLTALRFQGNAASLVFSTYVGGTANEFDLRNASKPLGIADDNKLCMAVPSLSTDAPTHELALDRTANGGVDAYIGCYDPNGAFLYGTYIGTSAFQYPVDIEAAGNGSWWVLIEESATEEAAYYPVRTKAGPGGKTDYLILQLVPGLSALRSSTRIGGTEDDFPTDLVTSTWGGVYYTGATRSPDFGRETGLASGDPLKPRQSGPAVRSGIETPYKGGTDIIIGELNSIGYSSRVSYQGGSGNDNAYSATLLQSFRANAGISFTGQKPAPLLCVSGGTDSNDFPTTTGAYDTSVSGTDAFVACIDLPRWTLGYSTLYGESGVDISETIACHPRLSDNAPVCAVGGSTSSTTLRETAGSFDPTSNSASDAFMVIIVFEVVTPDPGCIQDVFPGVASFNQADPSWTGLGSFTVNLVRTPCQWHIDIQGWVIDIEAHAVDAAGNNLGKLRHIVKNTVPLQANTSQLVTYGSHRVNPTYWASGEPVIYDSLRITDETGTSVYHDVRHTFDDPGEPDQQPSRAADVVPLFEDVPRANPFAPDIRLLRHLGVTSGCATNRYCPADPVTRGQMAVFIIRALFGSDNFVFRSQPYFTDVPANHPFFKWIQAMRELGITSGCAADRYCPDDTVTRGQMAVFIIRGLIGNRIGFVSGTPSFNDVPANHPFYAFIQAMKMGAITSGTGANQYSPDALVTREQMSAFLMRGFRAPH